MAHMFVSTTFAGPGRTDLAGTLALLDGLAIDGVELGSTHEWRPDLAAIAAGYPGRKLVHNYFPPAREDLVINLASSDPAVRQASLDHALSCLEMAAAIGAELYTVHPGFLAEPAQAAERRSDATAYDFTFSAHRQNHDEAFQLSLDALSRLNGHATRLGVGLAVETEGSTTHQGILLLERPDEYDRLLATVPGIGLTFNLAHSTFAAKVHGFDLSDFIARYGQYFRAVELSHNDCVRDLHAPLEPGSWVLDWLPRLPDVPLILEFREASRELLEISLDLVRSRLEVPS